MNDAPIEPIHQSAGILGYDLVLPVRPLLPAWTPFRYSPAEQEAGAQRAEVERRATEARVAQETEAALKEWRAFRDRHADNPIAIAVLDIHEPEAAYDGVVCSECEEHNGYEDTRQVEWPCGTYRAMKETARA